VSWRRTAGRALLVPGAVLLLAALGALVVLPILQRGEPDSRLISFDPRTSAGPTMQVAGRIEDASFSRADGEPWLGEFEVQTDEGRRILVLFNVHSVIRAPAVSKVPTTTGLPTDFPYGVAGLRIEGTAKSVATGLFGWGRSLLLVEARIVDAAKD
jgi:hypothetical protein